MPKSAWIGYRILRLALQGRHLAVDVGYQDVTLALIEEMRSLLSIKMGPIAGKMVDFGSTTDPNEALEDRIIKCIRSLRQSTKHQTLETSSIMYVYFESC